MKILKYTHPSANKYKTGISYSLDELKKELSLERIKVLFTPINFSFEEDIKMQSKNNQKNMS